MNKRKEGLDLLRLICAFWVISAHKPFPGTVGMVLAVFARMIVPIFLMITGFFSLSKVSNGNDGRPVFAIRGGYAGLVKPLKLLFLSNGLYLVIGICDHLADGTVQEYLQDVFSWEKIRDMLIFNKSPFAYHLWYLFALVYALAFVITMDKLGLRKVLYVLTPFLIAADFIFGRYSKFILGRYFPVAYTRNWLIFVTPNLCLGMMLKEYNIVERMRKHRTAIGLAALLFMAGSVFEYKLFKDMLRSGTRANYVCAVVGSILLFIWFAQIGEFRSWLLSKLSWLGREASAGIYVIHLFFMDHLKPLMKQLGLSRVYKNYAPLIIFVLSAITVCLYNAVKNYIKSRSKPSESNS